MVPRAIAALLVCHVPVVAGEQTAEIASINPIRKVVNLLQAMQKKVTAEGDKAEVLYQKYMCYCKTSGGDLAASISAAEQKVPQVGASIKAAEGRKKQLESDLKSHQTDRSAAKTAMSEATSIRQKEKTVYDKSLADSKANLAATRKASAAVSAGMGGSFMQTAAAGVLRNVVSGKRDMLNADRQEVLAFLSNQQGGEYAPASGEISGILKTMADEMQKDQDELIATESGSVKDYEGLMAAKKKEVAVLSKSIEEKLNRVAELGVEISTMKNDLEDTSEALESDKAFQVDLAKNCAEKTGIHEEEKKVRAEEVVALADTIKLLNDDDALELFKKTLPSASMSLLQRQESSRSLRLQARKILLEAQARPSYSRRHLDFILLALNGKKIGFEKVIKMVDDLVATLKTEQQDDNDKKEYCGAQFDTTDDKKKALERSVADLETVIAESKEGISTLAEEIAALKAGISALDKSVSEATEQRHAESAAYKDLMTSNKAAKELLLFAKNRLNKFYNPRLYKAAPERELSRGDQIYVNEGGDIPTEAPGGIANTGISALMQTSKTARGVAAPPPPATAAAYTKKAQESGGVIAMVDLLVADLDKEMTVAETEEKDAQADYEKTIADSADKRRQDSKTLTDKEAAKAELIGTLETSKEDQKSTQKELMGTLKYIQSLHGECDWLIQYFSVRQQARDDEIDSLGKAKAVLSGADYSLLQRSETARFRKFLHHA
jgi:hypothetical protein